MDGQAVKGVEDRQAARDLNGDEPKTAPLLAADPRVDGLLEDVKVLTWLLAEAQHRAGLVASTVAALIAKEMQPQIQQRILDQLTGR